MKASGRRYANLLVLAVALGWGLSVAAGPPSLRRPPTPARRLDSLRYSIPPFAVSFQSPNLLQGDRVEDLALLSSTIAGPLRDVFREFVYESFRIQTARLASDPALPQILRQLTLVDFDVSVVHSDVNQGEDNQIRRHLQQRDWFEFYAQFVGFAFFVGPINPNDQPEDDFMEQLLASWVEQYVAEDFSVLEGMLRDSEDPILQNHVDLHFYNDVELDAFPYPPYASQLGMENAADSQPRNTGDKFLLSLLVIVGTATLAALLFLARPYVVTYTSRSLSPHQGAFPSASDESLPGREEEIPVDPSALEESDRWLKQHRPDLFRALQRSSSYSANNGSDGIMKDSGTRRSNPLQFMYGGMFVRRNQGEQQLPSVSLASQDSETMEPFDDEFQDAVPSWWQKLTQSLQGQPLACDEDPSQYDFAFSDFPRHDGTPCLMFAETEAGPVLRRVSLSEPSTEPLSNDDFKMQLSMHGAIESGEDSVVVEDNDQGEDPEFTSKLERLIAMRHRHYEKERIIQRGREARDNERRQAEAEARERQLKLRRHEMEIDMEEIEAALTPRALSRKSLQTQRGFESTSDRRKSHRITVSDPDLLGSIQAASVGEGASTKSTIGGVDNTVLGGPRARQQYMEDDCMPPRGGTRHSRIVSDSSPRSFGVAEPDLTPKPVKHRRSHRRSFSHGTEEMEENVLNGVSRARSGSNAEDVMTFGIAAYTNFT